MPNDLIITGIPRSGTSYICSILNKVRDVVVINEPEEVFQIMLNSSNVGLPNYYNALRERICNGHPIKNKIIDGRFIEDTNDVDITSEYIPNVNRGNFMLGTKNTLIYLNALPRLNQQFKQVTIVACVRHPVDTIASWVNVSFPHIKNVEIQYLLEYCDDTGKKAIHRVLNKKKLAQRYAMWWDYLAKVVYKNSSNLIVTRYEDMVIDPQETINAVCEASLFHVAMTDVIEPSSPRSHRDKLSDEIVDAINKYCKNSSAKFGYKI